jgi:predicted nucleotidyltransferase
MAVKLDPRFKLGIDKIKQLSKYPRYEAALIFGSVAEGTSTEKSDLDIKVVVNEDNPCGNINHPSFDGYKLDITFRSFKQLEKDTNEDIKKTEREPNLLQAVILFDKTGELTSLQKKICKIKRTKASQKDYQLLQFMLYHANNKVERALKDDHMSSLYSMYANIGEVLKIHFKLNGKWWVSSKNVLKSLDEWDPKMANLVKKFVSSPKLDVKYKYWAAIIDHVSKPMGGRQSITENNCTCIVCKKDLALLA